MKAYTWNLIFFCAAAAILGVIGGRYSAATRQEKNEFDLEEGVGNKILMALTVAAMLGVVITGGWLLLTLRWGKLGRNLLISMCVLVLIWLETFLVIRNHRLFKYLRNPVLKEVAAYVKKNKIAAVQILPDRVRYFRGLVNTTYCRSEDQVYSVSNGSEALDYKTKLTRPAGWCAYDAAPELVGTLWFRDRGYTTMKNLEHFGTALRTRLWGFGKADHQAKTSYVESCATARTTYVTEYYADSFVYRRSDYLRLRDMEAQAEAARKKAEKQVRKTEKKTGPKSWE